MLGAPVTVRSNGSSWPHSRGGAAKPSRCGGKTTMSSVVRSSQMVCTQVSLRPAASVTTQVRSTRAVTSVSAYSVPQSRSVMTSVQLHCSESNGVAFSSTVG